MSQCLARDSALADMAGNSRSHGAGPRPPIACGGVHLGTWVHVCRTAHRHMGTRVPHGPPRPTVAKPLPPPVDECLWIVREVLVTVPGTGQGSNGHGRSATAAAAKPGVDPR